ncbi:uncharacterized protein N7529_004766 [Penicillium soppii]|jgi:hypothetical protein|uniref:uncharacterized protein n=1 Tax=Penicillium soppii TaxID=69789 RepID=UPI002549A365|nr:uncharacterized protein N7529_004766 [Penicillium soppii]KAJ5872413.1 hypothetical protein N7529_004766 [Penicillium soppii]
MFNEVRYLGTVRPCSAVRALTDVGTPRRRCSRDKHIECRKQVPYGQRRHVHLARGCAQRCRNDPEADPGRLAPDTGEDD